MLKGKINNLKIDSIHVKSESITTPIISYGIAVLDNGAFSDSKKVTSGYYSLEIAKNKYTVYLDSTFNLEIDYDVSTKKIKFNGKGSKENSYLIKKRNLEERLKKVSHFSYYAQLNEIDFIKFNDSLVNLKLELLEESGINNAKFKKLEKAFIHLVEADNANMYVFKNSGTTQHGFRFSSDYNPFERINVNDSDLLEIPFFPVFLATSQYYFLKNLEGIDVSSALNGSSDLDVHFEYLKVMDEYITDNMVKDHVAYLISKWTLPLSSERSKFYLAAANMMNDEHHLNEIKSLYGNLMIGSENFKLMEANMLDKNGEHVSLTDFKDGYFYIDFWSYTCKPCIDEFSYFNELVNFYQGKNIHFIGINTDADVNKWKNVVKGKDLQGFQLYMGKKNEIINTLGIYYFPRYLILDKEGKILDFNAKRPSENNLKTELLDLISKENTNG